MRDPHFITTTSVKPVKDREGEPLAGACMDRTEKETDRLTDRGETIVENGVEAGELGI